MAKATRKKAARRKPAAGDGGEITVRMFCQGLGDCFLITMPQKGDRPYSILIDCGVAKGTAGQADNMRAVVARIASLTHGVVDVLAVTHEHLDHVSGFAQAEEEFKNIEFRNVWFAWTENGRDKLAQELREAYGKAKKSLMRVRARLAGGTGAAQLRQRLSALDGVLAFHGLDGSEVGLAASGQRKPGDVERAMDNLRRWAAAVKDNDGVRYLKPGQTLELPGAASSSYAGKVRVFVLGPPHDRQKITRINPRKKNHETYENQKHAAAAAGVNWAWSAAVLGTADGGAETALSDSSDFDRSQPFDSQCWMSLNDAREWKDNCGQPFFQERYFQDSLENNGRRIDDDWLWAGARRLALHIESYTNNTSLVLAFHLPRTRKVLLFAGDAQVGNWLSWHDQTYEAVDGAALTAEELLAQTVLYKVGHHGSHNATLRERGLELMNHQELTAMLPVETEAVERLGYGEMPVRSLTRALDERCDRRVLRLDQISSSKEPPGEWDGLKKPKVSDETIPVGKGSKRRPLYVEYVIRD